MKKKTIKAYCLAKKINGRIYPELREIYLLRKFAANAVKSLEPHGYEVIKCEITYES